MVGMEITWIAQRNDFTGFYMAGREQQYGFRVRNSHDDIHHNTRTKEKNQIHPSQ